jgi:hypothetical protein
VHTNPAPALDPQRRKLLEQLVAKLDGYLALIRAGKPGVKQLQKALVTERNTYTQLLDAQARAEGR